MNLKSSSKNKISVLALLLLGIVCNGAEFSERICIDRTRLLYCSLGDNFFSPKDLHLYDAVEKYSLVRRLPNFTGMWRHVLNTDKCHLFPVPWTICKNISEETFLLILHPDLFHESLFEQVDFMSWIGSVDKQWSHVTDMPDWNGTSLSAIKSTHYMGGFSCLRDYYRTKYPTGYSEDCPFKVPWYTSSATNVLFRLPIKNNTDKEWEICRAPVCYRWMEICYRQKVENVNGMPIVDEFIKNAVDISPEGEWNPVGAARVAGRRVLSDSAEARFPKDADWLIWEKSPESSRLCKMANGKWATCPEMPVQKPPRLIVTDDDNGVVLLVYSFGIDQTDVEGSLRKVAKMLEERGFPLKPRPDKPVDAAAASASGAPGNEALKAASPSTNAVAVASVPMRSETNQVAAATPPAPKPAIMLRGTNHVAQAKASDDAAAAAKAFAEYGIKPEENAKRGAMMFERPETRDEGLRLLRESARNGSPFALARLSALYYTGDGGVKRDYAKAIKLMEAAASRGFPRFLLPLKEARKAMQREEDLKKKDKPGLWPGLGYPGAIVPYRANRTLQKMLDRYSLTAGVFRRDPIGDAMLPGPDSRKYLLTEEIPYLLFTPKSGSAPVPLVMYFGGTGEQGTDLSVHFRQRTIFEMVCSPEFQKKHPCYLFAPMVPKDSSMFCSRRYSPPMANLVCDAMYAVIRSAKSPSVDTNRLYLTGLSWGGSVAYTMPFGYPGRFGASVPVAGYATADCVPERSPGNFWLLFNEHEYADKGDRARLDEMIRTVTSRGGEFRVSSFPDKGHNSWDKAWREERVWDWMFSKTADGRAPSAAAGGSAGAPVQMRGARCTASKLGRDAKTGPERAADGLDSTCYVSKAPFKAGDWWQIEFAEPVSGRVIVKCGYANGRGRAKSAHVETSTNGSTWTRRGGFSRASGECRFPLSSPVRSIRVVSSSKAGEIMVVREVEIVE